jgi:hypothetical protein
MPPDVATQGLCGLAFDAAGPPRSACLKKPSLASAWSSSGPLFFMLPTALDTGRLTSTPSFVGFISDATARISQQPSFPGVGL